MDSILRLASEWRDRAGLIRRWTADEGAAKAMEACAVELERAVREAEDEVVTLRQAADRSGFHYDHVRKLVADGKIPNVGRPGAPRVRWRDVPRKSGPDRDTGQYDPEADARETLQMLSR